MPVVSTLGAMSSRGFGEFNQQAGKNYIEDFFSTYLYTGTGSDQGIPNNIAFSSTDEWNFYKIRQGASAGNSVTTDSSGNFYVTGYVTAPSQYGFVAKYNSSGAVQWQRYFYGGAGTSYGNSVAVNSSGDVYISGVTNGSNRIIKYNSSGTLQWARLLYEGANNVGTGIAVSAAGDVYLTGQAFNGTLWYVLVAKYNSSGTLQWQRKVTYTGSAFSRGIALDSASNVYVCAQANDGTRNVAALIKYNSSGTLQWKTNRYDTGGSAGQGVAVDSSDNVYMSATTNDGAAKSMILKFNSSGTLQWQRKFTNGSAYGVAVDSSGNSYIVTNGAYILKYDTSGVLQWQSQFAQGSSLGRNATIDSSGNLFVVGQATDSSGLYAVILKLKTATASSGILDVYLVPSNLTDAAGTAVESGGAGGDATATATENTGSPTDVAGTATASSATQVAVTASSGGLVWLKSRSVTADNALYDTARGATFDIASNTTTAQTTQSTGLTSFTSSGFTIGSLAKINTSASTNVSWTFKKQPKFFDVVTYTGTGVATTISHNLGSVPGMIIVKQLNTARSWQVYHRSIGSGAYIILNSTSAQLSSATRWNNTNPTSAVFSVGADTTVNELNGTYVAYLFAHNAGGFGADGSQNVISCGSFTTSNGFVNLGFEPQFFLYKNSTDISDWIIADNMRGWNTSDGSSTNGFGLNANTNGGEYSWYLPSPSATGVTPFVAGTYIYMAIRRGPMRTPTDATKVFAPVTYAGNSTPGTAITSGFVTDLVMSMARGNVANEATYDRLRGATIRLETTTTNPETKETSSAIGLSSFASMNGYVLGADQGSASINFSPYNYINWDLQRAPGFFDVVCYTGTGVATTQTHNLGVAPELMIVKSRSQAATNWWVYSSSLGSGYYLILNTTDAATAIGSQLWNSTNPTSSVFSIGTSTTINNSGSTYVAYLFATCPGVSKVGSYTGTGATQTISCGFTGGARYVLIKRTDSTGSWWVWDTARGMVAGTDPRLAYNSAATEINANWVYTTTGGFQIVTSDATVNASGGTYIYLAIA